MVKCIYYHSHGAGRRAGERSPPIGIIAEWDTVLRELAYFYKYLCKILSGIAPLMSVTRPGEADRRARSLQLSRRELLVGFEVWEFGAVVVVTGQSKSRRIKMSNPRNWQRKKDGWMDGCATAVPCPPRPRKRTGGKAGEREAEKDVTVLVSR